MPSHKPSSLSKKAEQAGVWRARLRVRPVRPRSGILAKLGPPKAGRLDQPIAASLDDLVPPDHFYRHLEQALDLGFVRDLVRDRYAGIGRPSIDPVVLFKLQLVLFFEGPRSEHQLLRVVADSLSLRWYVGYDLSEPLPDHSSLTRILECYGLDAFRSFFGAIVEQCIAAGLFQPLGLGAHPALDALAAQGI